MKHTKTFLPRLLTGLLMAGALWIGPGGGTAVTAQKSAAAFAPLPAGAPAAEEINAFLKADQARMPPAGAVLFMGSSSIRLWDTLAQDIPEVPVINRGFGGSQIFENTLYVDRIAIPYKPKMIVFFAGTNDLDYGH